MPIVSISTSVSITSTSVPISEFTENLAYDVDNQFGDKFKAWLGEDRNRNKGTEFKVELHDRV